MTTSPRHTRKPIERKRRAAAALSLAFLAASLALIVFTAITGFPEVIVLLACAVATLLLLAETLVRRGAPQAATGVAAGGFLVATIWLTLTGGHLLEILLVAGTADLSIVFAKPVFTSRVELPTAVPPSRPVLFFNPRSGGGKAVRFQLADEARKRGIDPVEFNPPGVDLESLVRSAIDNGADGLAMAGGDGSQATVAAIAAEFDLPYACIPAGTRNHFALDLGVDRDDVTGALDALVDGREKRVDLGEVNGRVFVNNVSLGLYAEAVQREGYREAKLRTLLKTATGLAGPEAKVSQVRLAGQETDQQAVAILVSNNQYRLNRAVGSGTRPRLDAGVLGVTLMGVSGTREAGKLPGAGWRQWTSPTVTVESESSVPAGIDGEATTLRPPLRFRARPGVLRVRIASGHPGSSPSAEAPTGLVDAVRRLAAAAFARDRGGHKAPASGT